MIRYKGFGISAEAFKAGARDSFLGFVVIERFDAAVNERMGRTFAAKSAWGDELFDTESEAIQAATAFGMKLIDGELAGLTIKDL